MTEVDALRGVAIIMMVAYHVLFDLSYFGLAQIGLFSPPLVLFQRGIGTLFLFLVGVSLALSEARNKEGYLHHAKRGLLLVAVALAITLVTWVYPHEGFITFGIIHLIALATFVAPLFFGLGRANAFVGLLLIAAGLLVAGTEVQTPLLFWLGLPYPGYTALDFYPVLPWLGVVLIGVAAGQIIYAEGKNRLRGKIAAWLDALAYLGRRSLIIYLAHQIILVGIILAYMKLALGV